MKAKPHHVRLDPDVAAEVKKIAEVTDLPEVEVIRQMVGAGVRVIMKNGYKLPLPLRLALSKEEPPAPHPKREAGRSELNAPKDSSSESEAADQKILDVIEKHYPTPKHPRRK